jgi:aspartyl-tRNA(Asn)/glutamyl-tRNA(Gln) amidotransferase subunit A
LKLEPHEWTVAGIADRVRKGELSAVEVTELALARIQKHNVGLNAFVEVDAEGARKQARRIDELVRDGRDPGLFCGVPVGVKDFGESVIGSRTTEGSSLLKDAPVATSDSVHVARLRTAGAIIIGRTAAAEFGLDAATTTELWGVTRNPWNRGRTPGGSSGGSAAAVAAGMVPAATGSDSGGSIRAPASHCGLVGYKPTFGRIPQTETTWTLNAVGVLVKTIRDAARHLDAVTGPDNSDKFSLAAAGLSYERALDLPLAKGLRVVFTSDLGYIPVDREIASVVRMSAQRFVEAAGLTAVSFDVAMPNVYPSYVISALNDLQMRVASEFSGGEVAIGPRLTKKMKHVELFTREKLYEARVIAEDARAAASKLFDKIDLIISPVTVIPPHDANIETPTKIGEIDIERIGVEAFPMWANFTGCPSISVPAGFTKDGLPVGMLITGPRLSDDILLRVASIWEKTHPWSLEAPAP